MKYVYALYWDCHLFLADPWSIAVLTEDVKGSFDSIEYQGTVFFHWKKKEEKKGSYFFCNIYHPFLLCSPVLPMLWGFAPDPVKLLL